MSRIKIIFILFLGCIVFFIALKKEEEKTLSIHFFNSLKRKNKSKENLEVHKDQSLLNREIGLYDQKKISWSEFKIEYGYWDQCFDSKEEIQVSLIAVDDSILNLCKEISKQPVSVVRFKIYQIKEKLLQIYFKNSNEFFSSESENKKVKDWLIQYGLWDEVKLQKSILETLLQFKLDSSDLILIQEAISQTVDVQVQKVFFEIIDKNKLYNDSKVLTLVYSILDSLPKIEKLKLIRSLVVLWNDKLKYKNMRVFIHSLMNRFDPQSEEFQLLYQWMKSFEVL